jgi:hypothetical protein
VGETSDVGASVTLFLPQAVDNRTNLPKTTVVITAPEALMKYRLLSCWFFISYTHPFHFLQSTLLSPLLNVPAWNTFENYHKKKNVSIHFNTKDNS